MVSVIVLLLCLAACAAQLGGGGMAGGFSPADVNDPHVREIAEFAVHNKYKGKGKIKKVISAQRQVVRGMNYDIVVEVTDDEAFREKQCTVDEFRVWDDLGKIKVTGHKYLPQDCT